MHPSHQLPVETIRAFLDDAHERWSRRCMDVAAEALSGRPHTSDDSEARKEARELLALMGEAGLYAPLEHRDLRGSALAREAVGWASPLADAVWALQGLGVTPLLLAGEKEVRTRWVPEVLAGRVMTGFAMTEPEAGSDVGSMRTRAVRDGGDYVLDGRKWLISNAGIADLYVVFASTDPDRKSRGISAFLVPADTPGFRFVRPQVMSAPHPLGEIAFESCRVPASALLGGEGEGFKIGMSTLDQLRPTVAAAANGMAARALDEALAHARRRRQFGQALAEFQSVQGKLGKMVMQLAAARLLTFHAAWVKDRGKPRITREAAAAKAFATEAAQEIIDEAVQIVGGIGVLSDHPVELLYRSVRSLRIYEGATEIQHMILAGGLLADARERDPLPNEGGAS